MDFGTLLHAASKNKSEKKEIKYYSTKFDAPKKEQRSKTLSVNVQKFLARKEEEEKKKQKEAACRRDKLLELRSHDKKATRRVNVMLKRTKSANQSVIQDAVDDDNTAVTLAGPSQPDEDDYGYVSQSASEFYNKMMEKYSKMPDEPKFDFSKKKVSTNLSSTKDRVRAALDREAEEALLPHRRKRKSKNADSGDGDRSNSNLEDEDEEETIVEKKEKEQKPKPKLKAAPVINFADLLKLAEKKQFEPIVIEKKEKEEERLFTKRQKRENDKEREFRESKEKRDRERLQQTSMPPPAKIPKLNSSSQPKEEPKKMNGLSDRIPKANSAAKPSDSKPKPNKPNVPPQPSRLDKQKPVSPMKTDKPKVDVQNRSEKSQSRQEKPVSRPDNIKPRPESASRTPMRPDPSMLKKALDGKIKSSVPNSKPKELPPKDLKTRPDSRPVKMDDRSKMAMTKPKQFPPKDLKPKQFPPDVRRGPFPPTDVRRGPPMKKKQPAVHKGKFYDDDDDEEYDSEMDDFIDDGPEGEEDYSKYISEIFGYDKRRYANVDDDVDDMETSFAQQMREEVISTKIGIKEDLEEQRKEEEYARRKALLKKKNK